MPDAFLVGGVRTPVGRYGGALSGVRADDLAALVGFRVGIRRRRASDQLNESPQAHEPVAFGLSMVKPCFSMVSTKSIVAPWM